jgi:hypothetical protein
LIIEAFRACVFTGRQSAPSRTLELLCQCPDPIRISGCPANFDLKIASFLPAQLRERIAKRREPRLRCRIALRNAHQHADAPHPVALLRSRSERPCCRASKQREELASLHVPSIPGLHPTAL